MMGDMEATMTVPVEETAKRKRGAQAGNQNASKTNAAIVRKREKVPRGLWAIRRALKTKDKETGANDVQAWRQLLRENPEKFLGHLARLEAAHQAAKGKAADQGAASQKVDEGEERVLELVDRLLAEIGVKP